MLNVPLEHAVQVAAPAALQYPTAQQTAAPAGLNVPAAQLAQESAPVVLYVFAAQAAQEASPLMPLNVPALQGEQQDDEFRHTPYVPAAQGMQKLESIAPRVVL